jgi:hypothetical protein
MDNRGYAPEQLITQFMLSVWCGANRFEQGELTRHDQLLLSNSRSQSASCLNAW